jgi:hypothetical protein
VQDGLDWLTYGITDLLTAAEQPIALRDAVAASAPRKVLLIAGGDRADEGHAGRYIQSVSPGTVDLWIVPGTGHIANMDTHPAQMGTARHHLPPHCPPPRRDHQRRVS